MPNFPFFTLNGAGVFAIGEFALNQKVRAFQPGRTAASEYRTLAEFAVDNLDAIATGDAKKTLSTS